MAKFKILIDQSLDDNSQRLTHYTKLLKDMEFTENGNHMYQDLPSNRFDQTKSSVKHSHDEIITHLALSVEKRFEDLINSPLFNQLAPILDVNLSPKNHAQLSTYCDWKSYVYEITSKHYLNSISMSSLLSVTSGIV